MNSIEEAVQAPVATPDHLISVVEELPSSSMEATPVISDSLRSKLTDIAERSGGSVALHGRLFKQWLHYLYPNECQYPVTAMSSTAARLSPSQWNIEDFAANATEKQRYIEEAADNNDTTLSQRKNCPNMPRKCF